MILRRTAPLGLSVLLSLPTLASAQTTPEVPVGKNVRVTLASGVRFTGKLVGLTATEVVLRQKGAANDHRQLLTDVQRIETRSHLVRIVAAVGAAAGLGVALASDLCGTGAPYITGQEPGCFTVKPLLYTGAGALVGALVGGGIDARRRQILFVAPTGSTKLVAIATPTHLGAGVVFRW